MIHGKAIALLKDALANNEYNTEMKVKALKIAWRREENDTAATLEDQVKQLEETKYELLTTIAHLETEQEIERLIMEQNLTRRQAEDLHFRVLRLERKRKENL